MSEEEVVSLGWDRFFPNNQS